MEFDNFDEDTQQRKETPKSGFCTIDGHLNSPITSDEVEFLLQYDQFYCWRHKHIKSLLKNTFKDAKSYRDVKGCPWTYLEENLMNSSLKAATAHSSPCLQALVEAAISNTEVHHEAYFGRKLPIQHRLDMIRDIFSLAPVQRAYRDKVKVEQIKSIVTDQEHLLGEFKLLSENISIEKEITIMRKDDQSEYYMFPTTMVICVLDNIQARFHLIMNVALKERFESIDGLLSHYLEIIKMAHRLRARYGEDNFFFELMKDWDARIIGMTVEDTITDLGFEALAKEIDEGWKEKMQEGDLQRWKELILCEIYSNDRDMQVKLAFYFANLSKNFGHPILNPVEGIQQLRENSKKQIQIDDQLAQRTLWKFRETFVFSFYIKRGRYPFLDASLCTNKTLKRCLDEGRLPTKREKKEIPLSSWAWVKLKKNFELNLDIDEKDLLKDTACSPPRDHWFIPYDQCAFKHLYDQKKPRSSIDFQPRVLMRYLQGEEGELAKKVQEQERFYYNHNRDGITQLCRKERELNAKGRVFCKQTYEMRLMQVALEKSAGDNILPFIKEQTMTNSELEVTKRMDKVASSISQIGHANINLDLSKWNQLQRHDLNKYIFRELDELHGTQNLYSDSHLWFNRCMVLLGSRLTPPEIGDDGEPLPGEYCHYDQYGGLEGMRQKCWTITTIMIIKLALEECGIQGETMGQGDNQVIHLTLTKEQQRNPQRTITLLLNTLDNLFTAGGLKLKMQETWYSKNLFEYSKVRFYKQNRIDDSLKRLNRLIPDINEGFPSLASYLTCASTCTENMSRNYQSPIIPFFTYSLEAANIFQRKNLASQEEPLNALLLLNCPSVFGGLPISNIFQHSQRGCPDPLTLWLKIWQTIRNHEDHKITWRGLLHLCPVEEKMGMDPITLVEDIYGLNIKGLPNFERKAREVVEEFLPLVITNPQVTRLIGATRDDLTDLCEKLITMRPYMANLAHEILRNSTEGVQLQLISSFTNVQTINKLINESGSDQTIYQMGKEKDKEAVIILSDRLAQKERANKHHIVEESFQNSECTYQIALSLRKQTWGFDIEGVTSPVPSEQIFIADFDLLSKEKKTNCIIAKPSHDLRTNGKSAFEKRGPFSPYLGSSTPEKMMKPKLSVINPNPTTKSITKLYYIRSYLERMNPGSNIIALLDTMIDNKLASLPQQFQEVPLSDWCGINYGGSYEHRFKASSQKRSALYSLSTIIATHLCISTNLLGQALRGNEDYNLFFQELFLFIQNYCAEAALSGERIPEEYGIPLMCRQCTRQIFDPKVQLDNSIVIQRAQQLEFAPANLIDEDKEHYVQTCLAAMSVEVGRKIATSRGQASDTHDNNETIGLPKTTECTERMSSNLMTEFRSCDIHYLIIGLLQNSKDLLDYIQNRQHSYPKEIMDHLAFLTLNSGRAEELFKLLQIPPTRHSIYTQSTSLMLPLAEGLKRIVNRNKTLYFSAVLLTGFMDDQPAFQMYLWRQFLPLAIAGRNLTKTQSFGLTRLPIVKEGGITDWYQECLNLFPPGISLHFRYPSTSAILMWRDLKGEVSDVLSPILPLSSKVVPLIRKEEIENQRSITYLTISPQIANEIFSFSRKLLNKCGSNSCPLWVKYIHHICRPVGRISTAASKMLEAIAAFAPLCHAAGGLVVTLAEGSGGILSLLAHLFPCSQLIYNTLQDETVEIKENITNVNPPALMGDVCHPLSRVVGLETTCMGCTDITKTVFQTKLVQLIDALDLPVKIFSMDAELKTDINNWDKLEMYLPIISDYMSDDGLFINKMFLTSEGQVNEIETMYSVYGLDTKFIKPSASHPHNHEFYVVGSRKCKTSVNLYEGETCIARDLIKKKITDADLLSLKEYRSGYMRHLISKVQSPLYQNFNGHPCLWSYNLFESEDPFSISPSFVSLDYQTNLVCLLLQVELGSYLRDQDNCEYICKYLSKQEIASLLVLSILTSQAKDEIQLVNILDTLSITRVNVDIVTGKHIRLGVEALQNRVDEDLSLIGLIGDNMKDYFRSMPYFNTRRPPRILLTTAGYSRSTLRIQMSSATCSWVVLYLSVVMEA